MSLYLGHFTGRMLKTAFLLMSAAAAGPSEAPELSPRIPAFTGEAATLGGPSTMSSGLGAVRGTKLGTSQLNSGFSLATQAVWEFRGGPVRGFVGVTSAPTFIWLSDSGSGWTLAMVDAGWMVGTDKLRIGPYTTVGLISAGAGVRAIWTPWESDANSLTGFEARLTWYALSAGNVGLFYVRTIEMGSPDLQPRSPSTSLCERFVVAGGFGSAVSSAERSWELVGTGDTLAWSSSPALAVGCESGEDVGLYVGMETAPRMEYRVPTLDGGADRPVRHFGSLTVGPMVGGERVQFGPVGTVGIWTLGGGVRAVARPSQSRRGAYRGLEVRGLVMAPSAPSAELMVLYHVAVDTRPR